VFAVSFSDTWRTRLLLPEFMLWNVSKIQYYANSMKEQKVVGHRNFSPKLMDVRLVFFPMKIGVIICSALSITFSFFPSTEVKE